MNPKYMINSKSLIFFDRLFLFINSSNTYDSFYRIHDPATMQIIYFARERSALDPPMRSTSLNMIS